MPRAIADNEAFYETIGQRIREIRTSKGLAQEALSKETGLTRQSVANIENGRQRFLVHTLVDLARALDVPASTLLPATVSFLRPDLGDQLEELSPTGKAFVRSVFDGLDT